MARKLQLIGSLLSGEIDPAKVKQIVGEYLTENPPQANITVNGVGPDENGNIVIQTQSGSGTSDSDNNVVDFNNPGDQSSSGSDTTISANVVEF